MNILQAGTEMFLCWVAPCLKLFTVQYLYYFLNLNQR